jgi:hypothetical protein
VIPGVSVSAFADPVDGSVASIAAATGAWTALSLHVSAGATLDTTGAIVPGVGIALEPAPAAVVRPVAELRIDGTTPGGLVGLVAAPTPALAIDAALLVGASGTPTAARVGLTVAATLNRRPTAADVATAETEPTEDWRRME